MKRILVVDDEIELVKAFQEILRMEGFEVDVAFDGASGFDLVLERPLDLVITDIAMPGMNGLDFVRAIRQVYPRLPVLLVSGLATEAELEEGLRLGANRYLRKPFRLWELVDLARELVGEAT